MNSLNFDRRTALLGLACLPALAGCQSLSTDLAGAASAVSKVAATVTTDVGSAVNLYGIAKGLGQVALAGLAIADPAAAAIVSAGIALVDPIVAKVQAGASVAVSDVSTILSQSTAILNAAAPAVTVVANGLAASK